MFVKVAGAKVADSNARCSAAGTWRRAHSFTSTRLMQVAHFLRDPGTSSRAAADVAETIDAVAAWDSPAACKLLQKLEQLEPDLLVLIFQHSKLPLHVALAHLPCDLHACALRSRVSEGRLVLQRQLRRPILPTLGLHFSTLAYVDHLDLSHNDLGRAASDLALLLCPLQVRFCHATWLCHLRPGPAAPPHAHSSELCAWVSATPKHNVFHTIRRLDTRFPAATFQTGEQLGFCPRRARDVRRTCVNTDGSVRAICR